MSEIEELISSRESASQAELELALTSDDPARAKLNIADGTYDPDRVRMFDQAESETDGAVREQPLTDTGQSSLPDGNSSDNSASREVSDVEQLPTSTERGGGE